MGRVSFSFRVGSVRRSRSACQGLYYLSYRVPLPPGALCASSGLSHTQALEEAAGGAVGTSPSGIHGLLSAPSSQAPRSWKDCAAALPAPDVSLLSDLRAPRCPSLLPPAHARGSLATSVPGDHPECQHPTIASLAECWNSWVPCIQTFSPAGTRLGTSCAGRREA